ncbi:MAG TPA: hypothetical protein VMV31_06880 [Terriglobales bacterium]|nr:hypothetical protein [Terriglobales bacterium]
MNHQVPGENSDASDLEGLSSIADAAEDSVRDLADTGQGFEADVIEGVERAADHPERPARAHQDPHAQGFAVDEPDIHDIV